MDMAQIYIIIAIGVLAVIAAIVFLVRKHKKKKTHKLTPFASIAFGLILAGIIFSGDRVLSYGLMGAGIIFAVVDIVLKLKQK